MRLSIPIDHLRYQRKKKSPLDPPTRAVKDLLKLKTMQQFKEMTHAEWELLLRATVRVRVCFYTLGIHSKMLRRWQILTA